MNNKWKAIGLHDDATAEVGQTIRVKTVDENNLPTEWETASAQVDWDEVTNKPFVKVGGDTLTWDGNTEGLASFTIDGSTFYKLSDNVPTKTDCANGISFVFDGMTEALSGTATQGCFEEDGFAVFDVVCFIPYDGYVTSGVSIPEAGVYFYPGVESITIPGYTGFGTEVIDTKVLPEALQFGETTIQGDTLEWDGNTEGLVSVMDISYKVSDAVPTDADIANGGSYRFDGVDYVFTADDVFNEGGVLLLGSAVAFFIPDEMVGVAIEALDGEAFPEAGTYFMSTPLMERLTIPNYTGFARTEIKPIEEKFIPDTIARKEDIQEQLDTIVVVSDTEPTDPDVTIWINTSEDSAEASAVEAHNTDENSHADIRAAIPTTPADLGLTTEALTFYYEDGTSRVVEVYVK